LKEGAINAQRKPHGDEDLDELLKQLPEAEAANYRRLVDSMEDLRISNADKASMRRDVIFMIRKWLLASKTDGGSKPE
jgi:hypothetical protein